MTSKNHFGYLSVGLALAMCAPTFAGWGSSFGGGGSFGSSYGSSSFGSSFGGSHGGAIFTRSHSAYSSYGSGGSHGGFLRRIASHHRSYASTGSSFASTGSTGSSTGVTAYRASGSWGGSSGGSGLFHGGLINKLRTHHQRKMSWLRTRRVGGSNGGSNGGSSGGSWGGSTGSSSHGGWTRSFASSNGSSGGSSGGAVSYAAPTTVTSGEVVGYGGTASFPVEYPVESYPVESYPVESYPVESYPVESYPVETYPMDGIATPVEANYPVEASYPVEDYQGGFPVEAAAPVEAEATIQEGFSTPTDAPTVDAPTGDAAQEPTLAEPPTEPVADPNLNNSTQSQHGDATIVVALPSNAKLYVNGLKTESVGQDRQFVSRGLKRGLRYPYQIKAVVDVAGQEVVMTKEVVLTAGEETGVAFNFDIPVETQLTVRVPEDAELTIAGAKTSSKGAERKFTTRRLTSSQTWSDYKVVVTINRGGRKISKEQSIDLRGGENRTLAFDFDINAVASR